MRERRGIYAQRISHTGSWAFDVARRHVTYSSEEHHRLFGFDPAAAAPGLDDWIDRIHPDDREMVNRTMQRTISDRRDYDLQHRVVHPDGTIKFIYTVGLDDVIERLARLLQIGLPASRTNASR